MKDRLTAVAASWDIGKIKSRYVKGSKKRKDCKPRDVGGKQFFEITQKTITTTSF